MVCESRTDFMGAPFEGRVEMLEPQFSLRLERPSFLIWPDLPAPTPAESGEAA